MALPIGTALTAADGKPRTHVSENWSCIMRNTQHTAISAAIIAMSPTELQALGRAAPTPDNVQAKIALYADFHAAAASETAEWRISMLQACAKLSADEREAADMAAIAAIMGRTGSEPVPMTQRARLSLLHFADTEVAASRALRRVRALLDVTTDTLERKINAEKALIAARRVEFTAAATGADACDVVARFATTVVNLAKAQKLDAAQMRAALKLIGAEFTKIAKAK